MAQKWRRAGWQDKAAGKDFLAIVLAGFRFCCWPTGAEMQCIGKISSEEPPGAQRTKSVLEVAVGSILVRVLNHAVFVLFFFRSSEFGAESGFACKLQS